MAKRKPKLKPKLTKPKKSRALKAKDKGFDIAAWRKRMDLSHIKVASITGVAPSEIASFESGNQTPSPEDEILIHKELTEYEAKHPNSKER